MGVRVLFAHFKEIKKFLVPLISGTLFALLDFRGAGGRRVLQKLSFLKTPPIQQLLIMMLFAKIV